MIRLDKPILSATNFFNWIAAAMIVAMMILTCADVMLRFFRHPIPGTYEIIGMLGAIVISFSLAYTSVQKGHIAVEFLVQKLPRKMQYVIDAINGVGGISLFGIVTWHSFLYASDLYKSGEVSLTIQMPIYPFVFGIAIGCGLLCIVLVMEFIKTFKRILLQ